MKTGNNRNKILIIATLILALGLSSSSAYARDGGWGYHHPRGYHWYSGHWWLGDAIIAGLVTGTVLATLPPHHRAVYVSGARYYYDGAYYYEPGPGGYVVVPNPTIAPVVVPAPMAGNQATYGNSITINVPSSHGGYTPVTLIQQGNGYVGPQGEYYPGHPTVSQLQALYGN